MPEKPFRKVYYETETPAFVVRFWDVSRKKLLARGHDIKSKSLSKKWAKQMFAGNIGHVQSGDHRIFHSVSEFHKFVEDHRV